MQLRDNTILMTGGGSGIGRGLAEAFHKVGNKVVITGRSQDKLDDTTAANPGIESVTVDVADPASVSRLAEQLIERFPTLNVLVNNAGMMALEDVTTGAVDAAEATIATNLLGPIRLTAALLPHFMKQPNAAVINVTSGLAFVPMPMTPTYCATKAALHSYSISLRAQLTDTNVHVIELAPPYVQTYLTGEQQANDPRAMPLDEYINEVMSFFTDQPDADEVLVERVKPLRFAEANGTFDKVLEQLSELGRERASLT